MRYKDNNIRNLLSHRFLWQLLLCAVLLMAPCSMFNVAHAQPTIKGNVYGGGREGDTGGNTTVTVCAVDLDGDVFGGARQANVGGRAFVHINGEKMSDDILINHIYGGNDVAGTIGASIDKNSSTIPDELTEAVANGITKDTGDSGGKNKKNENGYSAFVLTTKEKEAGEGEEQHHLFIGQLFGGGNGDYDYTSQKLSGETPNPYYNLIKPDIAKTYIEMRGGSCAILYGGGNAVTITEATDICIDNTSDVTTVINDANGVNKLADNDRLKRMGIYKIGGESYVDRPDYQFSRVFGGNNKATMAIRPTWHLKQGLIRNLYSGGNQGPMTYPNGIYLHIKEETNPKEGFMGLTVGNVYGGCRMADVNPDKYPIAQETIEGIVLPAGFAARVTISGGNIGNVYGGNDVSGTVYGGCAVGIHSSVNGDVYGGGNGSYAYTDNPAFKHKDDEEDTEGVYLYGDFFYDVNKILKKSEGATFTGLESVQALNLFRPNAEKVTVRLISDHSDKPTIIGGSVYCGGNSATLRSSEGSATAELKIGSYVYADNVFLGNNGDYMVKEDVLKMLADNNFSKINLTVQEQMNEYMKGCEMGIRPSVVFDTEFDGVEGHTGYIPYSTYFGSLYCGGNVGSVNVPGMNTFNFNQKLVIFNKLVGGCNSANVPKKYDGETQLNAAYNGGLIADPDVDGNKLTLKLSNIKIQPMRWVVKRKGDSEELYDQKDLDDKGNVQYILDDKGNRQLEWNTIYASTGKETPPVTSGKGTSSDDDLDRRLKGGNIYGGCYNSGHIEGNVIINIDKTLMDPDVLFDEVEEDHDGEAILYGHDSYTINDRRSGVILDQQGMDVLGSALNIFGGGKGKDTEIWGSTTINLNGGYVFQIFGGSEEGVIGKSLEDNNETVIENGENIQQNYDYIFNGKHYAYSPAYSCYVNLKGDFAGVTKTSSSNSADMAECEFMYGGGFFGPICGNTVINLGKGRIFNSFAGSCMADILGHAETYIGRMIKDNYQDQMGKLGREGNLDNDEYYEEGFPWVRDITYGGNDLGGLIMGKKDFSGRVRSEAKSLVYNPDNKATADVLTASAYTEYLQGRADAIFGGCYGTYDYKDPVFDKFTYTRTLNTNGSGNPILDDDNKPTYTYSEGSTKENVGKTRPGYSKPYMDNAFVNFRPTYPKENNKVNRVYGAGQGADQETDSSREGDKFQNSSYLLIDIPANMDYYKSTAVFGGGSFNGVGMKYTQAQSTIDGFNLNNASAIIDLVRGEIGNVYGGSHNEGIVRRSVVNVPTGSTINVNNIFGGGFGRDINIPCDVFETHVNYHSEEATVRNNLYGGNNHADRTLYGQINITTPVWQNKEEKTLATVYGAGRGVDTWSQYTEVNLLEGARVKEAYGGGENGRVINKETLDKWKEDDPALVLDMHDYKDKGLEDPLVKTTALGGKYNTNVHIHKGAVVEEYAYGGGYGDKNISHSGDVYGTTYIDLLGGIVKKDIYAAGTSGSIQDGYETNNFTAGATAYIAGGSCRNVYGGGWKGAVGKHTKIEGGKEIEAGINDPAENDISAETHVVIGIRKDQASLPVDYGFYNGVPTIQRNAYGGGEGGAVYGKAYLTLNNGYIGYEYVEEKDEHGDATGNWIYKEKLDDETYTENGQYAGENRLRDCGNVFGGGYDALSSVDESDVTIWGGIIRSSLHGGGEIATIGRGSTRERDVVNHIREFQTIYKAGKTHVEMYNGHVLRNVFAGGKGYNLLGYGSNSGLYTDGYVFGQTEVLIHGGEIGTEKGVEEKGYGNVFAGGDLGYVYSKGYSNTESRKTGTGSPDHYYYYSNDYKCKGDYGKYKKDDIIDETAYKNLSSDDKAHWEEQALYLTEDCKVVIAPYLQIAPGGANVTFGKDKNNDDIVYKPYDYVPTDYLNTLPKDKTNAGWTNLITNETIDGQTVDRGVIIHNAVFAGGNVASNSDTHYANATTVYGNVTATLYDVYHRDFITIGAEHVGGLYGGGNLSMVDGYRELNITNYGTDYYSLEERITIEDYQKLSNRERAYFQLEYECQTGYTAGGKTYKVNDKITGEEYDKLDATYKNETYWKQYGFCSIYAGRLLNTIQRADMCGVYGSRMVLQGAKDRVADVGEDVDYTINRVGELSLNKQNSVIADDASSDDAYHGNYFGIYSIVHYLGNLTSDVRFVSDYLDKNGDRVEKTDKTGYESYYTYKEPQPKGIWRNQGTCHNHVALASGVYLELTTENSTGTTVDKKDWGYITGVVELDLINVKLLKEGGGYVYAKNEHRLPMFYADMPNVILSEYNKNMGDMHVTAKTYKRYRYSNKYDDGPKKGQSNDSDWPSSGGYVAETGEEYKYREIQTSGNFIHAKKRIVDDCFPVIDHYKMDDSQRSPAHYWYLKGSVYVYDQIVSAYTGAAAAYSKEALLPLSITAASNGQLKLLNVKPNRYAYFDESNPKVKDGKIWVNHQADAYELNDVITWWDWQNLPSDEQALFVEETYVNAVACKIDGKDYAVGEYVMLPPSEDYKTNFVENPIKDSENNAFEDDNGQALTGTALFDYVFRTSNNLGHDTGYVLTFDMDTPKIWDDYYTRVNNSNDKITKEEYDKLSEENKKKYVEGPTFSPKTTGVYGKRDYSIGQILTEAEYNNFASDEDKQKVKPAYVAKEVVTYTVTDGDGTKTKTINPGTAISATEYTYLSNSGQSGKQGSFAEAFVCTNSIKLADEVYILRGELLTEAEITTLKDTYAKDGDGNYTALADEIDLAITRAYICTEAGKYGGSTYSTGTNYNALTSWCTLSKADRDKFAFNYDALDLFADPNYSVDPNYVAGSDNSNIEMRTTTGAYDHLPANTANGNKIYSKVVDVEYNAVFKATSEKNSYTYSQGTLYDGESMSSTYFENEVRNDKRYYTRVNSATDLYDGKYYVVNTNFIYNGEPYSKGQVVSYDFYTHNTTNVDVVTPQPTSSDEFYYCYETHNEGGTVKSKGLEIKAADYANLVNDQQYFDIQGKIPEETTTLYVNRESDIKDVTQEKVITVVYQYTYYEEDDDGDYKLTNELHVVNVHLQMESGIPVIGPLENPPLVLPGDAVGLKLPEVTPGAYEVLTNGWELFADENDAIHHRNGVPFTNNETPVYWYQNGKNYIAYYSKTYLGKTYSNYVPLAVANYHDIADIMERQKENHLYIDRTDVDRPCKIYINDYSTLDADDLRKGKNGLDELKALYNLSLLTTTPTTGDPLEGHALLNEHVRGCENLEIILRTDIDRTKPAEGDWMPWTPIGGTTCFGGNVHGDGHTISGLETSLFDKLCGDVYNLGVTGSFTGAGIAETGDGYVENCWVKTTGTPTTGENHYAVFGNPSRTGENHLIQVVNCYYPESNNYTVPSITTHGKAKAMPDKAFYNGEVAYNLNGFYLGKRYYDGIHLSTGEKYRFIKANADGSLPTSGEGTQATTNEASYPIDYAWYKPEHTTLDPNIGYVEHRFYDGDFRYADGTIPENVNIRRQENIVNVNDVDVTDITWVPIWPDDYLFFGQKLTYGHVEDQTHQPLPSTINKANERLLTSDQSNRVYRAPAYLRNNTREAAHFNPYAVFAKTNSDKTMDIHKDMTAIDFTGYNDSGYEKGWNDNLFYQPLLDDDGLTDFVNVGLTKNLLAYTFEPVGTGQGETPTAAQKKTANVVSKVLHDYEYKEENSTYHTVDPWDQGNMSDMHGHWVKKTSSGYVADYDHYLVDKEDFNAPISYTFANGKRMWYQRIPDNYVTATWSGTPVVRTTKGWDGVSLPFKVDIVTSQTKGELTHFYGSSATGHEYWLREFTGGKSEGELFKANMEKPDANNTDGNKEYTNTFLWDYYYSKNDRDDANRDDYQQYYSTSHTYESYPRQAAGIPYLVGFPGETYYEFDLSGKFEAKNTAKPAPAVIEDAQVITFASAPTDATHTTTIGVSYSEKGTTITTSGSNKYTFRTNYLNWTFDASTEDTYALDNDGDSYDLTKGKSVSVSAFRPYFIKGDGGSGSRQFTRSIVFSDESSKMGGDDRGNKHGGILDIYAKRKKIVVASTLPHAVDVRIVTTGGITLSAFTVEPGETVETRVNSSGIYIVHTSDARYTTKLSVR